LVHAVVVADDDVDKANIFGNYFSGVYIVESDGEFKELPSRGPAVSCEDVAFSEEAILDFNNLKVKKYKNTPRFSTSLYFI